MEVLTIVAKSVPKTFLLQLRKFILIYKVVFAKRVLNLLELLESMNWSCRSSFWGLNLLKESYYRCLGLDKLGCSVNSILIICSFTRNDD